MQIMQHFCNLLSFSLRRIRGIRLFAGLCFVFSTTVFALEPAGPAPSFDLPGMEGQVKLSNYKGKFVYVDFWASWCGPCKQSFPWMNEIHAKYASKGFHIIAVNLDEKEDEGRKFLNTNPARFAVAFDPKGATARSFGIKGMPSSVLIGPDGKVIFEHAGFREANKAELELKIKQALKEK